jgi:hypothetical protein
MFEQINNLIASKFIAHLGAQMLCSPTISKQCSLV